MVKFDINVHNFGHNGSNSIEGTFLDSSYQNLLMICKLFGFARAQTFAIVLVMTSFVITRISN